MFYWSVMQIVDMDNNDAISIDEWFAAEDAFTDEFYGSSDFMSWFNENAGWGRYNGRFRYTLNLLR